MTKKVVHKKQKVPSSRPTWLWIVGAALLLVVGGFAIWNSWSGQATVPIQVTGAPRLAVDQTTIDEGDVKLGKTIRTAFRLQNVGDQPLEILGEPQVEVVEGC